MSRITGAGLATLLLVASPTPVSAHPLVGRVESPLPLELYLAGAALAVSLSFFIAFARSGRHQAARAATVRRLPRGFVLVFRGLGLLAWGWVVAQFVVGGSSDAEVGRLFTWVYGWVGLAILCALVAPVWDWLDPFVTLHDIGAWALRRLRVKAWRRLAYPAWLSRWPAAVGFTFFIWLELAHREADMDAVVVAYTAITLTAMAVFGKERWRRRGEVFSVWFGLLGRLARFASSGPAGSGLVRAQRFPDGLLARPWDASLVSLLAIATGAILYDGLSQTEVFFDLFATPDLATSTLLLGIGLGVVIAIALGVGARVGIASIGAGLLPISVGYLIAHYLTYLLGDGQRIAVALADPFQQGWDLTGTAFFVPSMAWLPASVVWVVMFVAVVGGHVLGASAGHHRSAGDATRRPGARRAQIPLALVMVGLTTLTLWSLGQAVLVDPGSVCPRRLLEQRGPRSFLADEADAVPSRLTAEIPCR